MISPSEAQPSLGRPAVQNDLYPGRTLKSLQTSKRPCFLPFLSSPLPPVHSLRFQRLLCLPLRISDTETGLTAPPISDWPDKDSEIVMQSPGKN